MAQSSWGPEPPKIPLVLIATEDFVRELTFDGPVNTFPAGTTITLVFYDSEDADATQIGSWPAVVGSTTAKWSVNRTVADALPAPGGYRLMISQPNPSDPSNPTIERCLALGRLTRK
ncbi:DUF7264 domain-containing protein [Prescottella agglutinans]|uniref:LtfC/p132/Gp6 beta-sandwich domain-containing protein n=1 Tax=Prescottella agglutinans TaxID=1644129 RepID=A0ABT6MG08_9NOCA|nr:hypothetical protein [Prescottella agglutinans]MDH6283241.1 hypothetical protein [Prescottella agglutinans]